MSTSALTIEAIVADSERPALLAAAEQLSECMRASTGTDWKVDVNFHASAQNPVGGPGVLAVVASMLREIDRCDMEATSQRLKSEFADLAAAGVSNIFLCTIFRHVPFRHVACEVTQGQSHRQTDNDQGLLERIRALNMLAIDLSHATGIALCDIDRSLAHLGARGLKTDYRLSGAIAAEVAAHTIVSGLLDLAMDDRAAPDVLERARHFHGSLWEINQLLRRRLSSQSPIANTYGSYKAAAVDVVDPRV